MSFLRTLFLGDWGNYMHTQEVAESVRRARHTQRRAARQTAQRVAALEDDVDELRLTVAALARVLVESGATTPDTLRRVVAEIDAADGTVDGKLARDADPGPAADDDA